MSAIRAFRRCSDPDERSELFSKRDECTEKIKDTQKAKENSNSYHRGQKVQEFDNVSEFAGYISDEFMEAESKMHGL